MFDWKKPTVQMLGRWQPWHKGHQELFKRAWTKTGQVCIMCRDVPEDTEANEFVPGQDDNPFPFEEVKKRIVDALSYEQFVENRDFIVIQVPNLVDISYGRGVGYTFTEHDLGSDVHNISATKIRAMMREKGLL